MPDQEFHEVQLTFKKLFFLFMCAVILAGVIFSFGVSVGRGVRDGAAQPSSDVATDTTVPADPSAVASAKSDSSSTQALAARGADPATVTPPAPPEEPTPTPVPAGQPAVAAAPPAAEPKAPPAAGGFIVQVEAFGVSDIATREVAKLKRKGYPAKVFTAPDGTPGPRFKVQVGPYATRAEADKTMKALRTEGYKPLIRR